MWKHKITGETKTERPQEYRANPAIPSNCTKCNNPIHKGDFIQWVKRPGQKGLIRHTHCEDPRVSPWIEIPTPDNSFEICNCRKNGNTRERCTYTDMNKICANCGIVAGNHRGDFPHQCPAGSTGKYTDTVFVPISEPKPEARPDELFDMQVPDSEPNFDETPAPAPTPRASSNGSDALLDLISERVESKVIDDIRSKVDSSIKIIEKTVQDKLDKLSIPSIEIKRPELPNVKLTHVHKQFKEVLELLNAGEYVYLHGSPGGHKSSIGPQLAEALGVRYGYMSLCEQTPEYVVKGFTSPIDGKYYESMFVDFYENGGLFCWEELDAANDNLRTALNTMLENKMAALDKGLIKMSDKFYLLGNGNTCGRGAHPAFPSRTSFDAAFAARFFFLEFEYDWDLAKHISLGLNKHSGPVVDWAKDVSNWALCNGVQLVMSPREVYKIAKLAVTTSLTADRILDGVLRGLDIPSKEKLLSNYPFPKLIRG